MRRLVWLLLLVLLLPGAWAQQLREQIRKYTLDNGLRVLMVPDKTAPVIHFNLMFDVGGWTRRLAWGIAHMVEHMAFKGTPSIGSLDWPKEKAALGPLTKPVPSWIGPLPTGPRRRRSSASPQPSTRPGKRPRNWPCPTPLTSSSPTTASRA